MAQPFYTKSSRLNLQIKTLMDFSNNTFQILIFFVKYVKNVKK